jgi:hypothetical protein
MGKTRSMHGVARSVVHISGQKCNGKGKPLEIKEKMKTVLKWKLMEYP